MRISEFHLIRYGQFSARTLHLPLPAAAQTSDIHLIAGPNEAGKSTLRQAIGDLLFGIAAQTKMAFIHPMPELRLGATLQRLGTDAAVLDTLAFERSKGNKNTLHVPEGAVLPDAALAPWLAQLQREAYERMYALDHDRLIEGGKNILDASNDLGRLLFQSAAGIEHLGQVLKQLGDDADALWAPRKSGARLYYQARDQFEAASQDLRSHMLRAKDWQARYDALQRTNEQLHAARDQLQALSQQRSRLERIRRVSPALQALDAARQRRSDLFAEGEVLLLAQDAPALLASARSTLAQAQADNQRLIQEQAQHKRALEHTTLDHRVLALATEITELNEQRLQFRAHRSDMAKREQEIHTQWLQVQTLATGLGWQAQTQQHIQQRLPIANLRTQIAHLLKRHRTLHQALLQAQDQAAERTQSIAQLQYHLQTLPAQTQNTDLVQALEAAQALAQHDKARVQLQHQCDALEQQIEAALSTMGCWRQPIAALSAMLAPSAATVQALQQIQRDSAAQVHALDESITSKTESLHRTRLELEQLVRSFQPVSLEQVQQARAQRDTLWQSIKSAATPLPEQQYSFEQHMSEADRLADARQERAQHEADRLAKLASAEHLEGELAALRARQASVQARQQQLAAQWQALANSCNLAALPLDMAATWLEHRQNVLALLQEQRSLQQRLHTGDAAAEHARQALWTALQEASATAATQKITPTLSECLRQARTRIKADDQTQGQRNTLQQQLADAKASLPVLQGATAKAQNACAQWSEQWQTVMTNTGFAVDTTPDAIEVQQDTWQQIEQLLTAIQTTRSERIDAMQADLDTLHNKAQTLAQRIAPELAAYEADDIALALVHKLDEARQAQTQAKQLHSQLSKTQAGLAAAQQQQTAAMASLAPLMAVAATQDIDALGRAIERSDQRHEIEGSIQQAQQQLASASDGLPEAELREQAAYSDPDTRKATLDGLDQQTAELMQHIEQLGKQQGVQQTELAALGDSSAMAQAESRRQEAISAMAGTVQQYLRLNNAALLLRWAIEQFRQTRQGPMLARASDIFSTLTQGAFDRLVVDAAGNAAQLISVRQSGAQVPISGMSEGTRDQLYLALRIAALQLQAQVGTTMPFIADDLFINFDDGRAVAGLKVLGELARHMQVIVLTHHTHLVPLAQQALGDQLNIVQL